MASDPQRSHNTGGAALIEEQRRRLRAIRPAARFIAIPVIALVLIHTLLIALWSAPATPAREDFGNDRLRSYVMPWFNQNWSIFAPDPKRVVTGLEVRAFYEDDGGDAHTSEWLDLASLENATVQGNPFVSRSAMISRRLADRLHSTRKNMNDEQLQWLAANYFVTPIDELRNELVQVDGGANAQQVDRYIQADEAARFLATAVAGRLSNTEVTRVQYRTSTQRVPDWKDRYEMPLEEQQQSYRKYGWRAPVDISEEELNLFDAYLHRLDIQELGQ